MKARVAALANFACAIMIAACSTISQPGVSQPVSPRALSNALPGTEWETHAFNGNPVPTLMTIRFGSDGAITGGIVCNTSSGRVIIDAHAIRPLFVSQTAPG